jgi:hypothetical protein
MSDEPKNSFYRSVECEDIYRRKSTSGRTGDPVFLAVRVRRVANDEDRDGATPAYAADRVGARARRTAEIENDDVRLAVTDQIEEMVPHRIRRRQSAFRRARD